MPVSVATPVVAGDLRLPAEPVTPPMIAFVTVMSVAHSFVSLFVVSPMVCPED
jgi:hypothetical protein